MKNKTFGLLLLIMLMIQTSLTHAKVQLTTISDYMLLHTSQEGYSGSGFFILNENFTAASKQMKEKLGIREHKKHSNADSNYYSTKKQSTKKQAIQHQQFAQKVTEFADRHNKEQSNNVQKVLFSAIVTKKELSKTDITFNNGNKIVKKPAPTRKKETFL